MIPCQISPHSQLPCYFPCFTCSALTVTQLMARLVKLIFHNMRIRLGCRTMSSRIQHLCPLIAGWGGTCSPPSKTPYRHRQNKKWWGRKGQAETQARFRWKARTNVGLPRCTLIQGTWPMDGCRAKHSRPLAAPLLVIGVAKAAQKNQSWICNFLRFLDSWNVVSLSQDQRLPYSSNQLRRQSKNIGSVCKEKAWRMRG